MGRKTVLCILFVPHVGDLALMVVMGVCGVVWRVGAKGLGVKRSTIAVTCGY